MRTAPAGRPRRSILCTDRAAEVRPARRCRLQVGRPPCPAGRRHAGAAGAAPPRPWRPCPGRPRDRSGPASRPRTGMGGPVVEGARASPGVRSGAVRLARRRPAVACRSSVAAPVRLRPRRQREGHASRGAHAAQPRCSWAIHTKPYIYEILRARACAGQARPKGPVRAGRARRQGSTWVGTGVSWNSNGGSPPRTASRHGTGEATRWATPTAAPTRSRSSRADAP